MLVNTLSFFSLLTVALAIAIREGEGPISVDGLVGREDSPTDQDLLSSCPGGPGSPNVEHADRCTLINIVHNADVRQWTVLGDPQLNCGGATDPVTVTLGGETTTEQSVEINANLGVDLEGISIGGGASYSSSSGQTVSRSIQYSIPPGRQAVYVAGIAYQSETGNIQVNYGDRQFGHYIWYTGTSVTQLTPYDPVDVQYDVHESDCGTDPRNLQNFVTKGAAGL